jgi:nucleotide-binding universal stress UspA family protein
MTIKQILVPIDFSEPSLAGLDYAIELSRTFKASVLVLFVVEVIYYAGESLGLLLDDQRRRARADLDRLAGTLAKRRVKFDTLLETGLPAQAIADTAHKRKIDLIVMATHGRTGLSHMLLGSVAERVVRTAPCPVLTIPSHKPARRAATKR